MDMANVALYTKFFVPNLSHILLFINTLTRQEMTVKFMDEKITIPQGQSKNDFEDICTFNRDNLYGMSLFEF